MLNTHLFSNFKKILYWGMAVGTAIALKQFYSIAETGQLQFQLLPLVISLELFSDLSFHSTPQGEWIDNDRQVSIVKACAGINFLIISMLGGFWRHRESTQMAVAAALSMASAWLLALIANTIRILLCIKYETSLSQLLELSAADSHRLIGIVVYFTILLMQLSRLQIKSLAKVIIVAISIFSSITVGIPITRSWLLNVQPVNTDHIFWILSVQFAITSLIVILYSLTRLGAKIKKIGYQ